MADCNPPILRRLFAHFGVIFFAGLLGSCASYRSDVMLEPVDEHRKFDASQVVEQLALPSKEYVVRSGDFLQFRIFTNYGESIIDPNGELRFGSMAAGGGGGAQNQVRSAAPAGGNPMGGATGGAGPAVGRPGGQATGADQAGTNSPSTFEVLSDGRIRLPLVGSVQVTGLRLTQIDSVMEGKFSAFYKEVFVETRIGNQRVVVLGGAGFGAQVIPLTYQTTSLLEVLALAGGIQQRARASNIRLIRGSDPRTAQVQVIDLTTPAGMRKANAQVVANDVVYIEPVRRPVLDALTDNLRFLGIASGLAVIASVFLRFIP